MLPQEFSLINSHLVWESFPKSGSEMDSRVTPQTAGKQKISHYIMNLHTRAVLFWLFPKTVNLPPKPVGIRLTFIQ